MRQLFLQHLAQTSDIPLALEIEKAEGVWMWDKEGKKYLDLISGIAVSALGHRHPKVLKAIQAQLDRYMHLMVYGEFVQEPQVQFAQLLTRHLPANLNAVYFTNSGTEATEGAMKLAKRITGRTNFAAFRQAYHGSSQGALSLAGEPWLQRAFLPLLPQVNHLTYNDFKRLKEITEDTAAVFAECVQSEAGGSLPESGFLQALRERCNETGTLLVLDEIQTGFGRTGTLWAFEQEGIVPDILLLGKALGGGMPLGAFISSQENMRLLSHDPVLGHITTTGGHPVSCAAGLAAFQVLLEEKLPQRVGGKERLLRDGLKGSFKNINGRGLLLALELENFDQVQAVIRHAVENGVVTDWFLFNNHSVRLAPPLIISNDEIIFACEVLSEAVRKL